MEKNVLCVPGVTVDAASLPLCLRPLGKKDALCMSVSVHKFVSMAVETLTREGLMEGADMAEGFALCADLAEDLSNIGRGAYLWPKTGGFENALCARAEVER